MDNLSLEYPCGIRIHQLFLNSIFNHFNNTLLIQEANLQAKNHYTICSNPKIAKNTCTSSMDFVTIYLFFGWMYIDIHVFWRKLDGHVYEGFRCLRQYCRVHKFNSSFQRSAVYKPIWRTKWRQLCAKEETSTDIMT
jgi:hypothetical protein